MRGVFYVRKAFGISIHDDMFKATDPRYYVNPYNPYDPSTAFGREQLSVSDESNSTEPGKTVVGLPRISILSALIAFFIIVGLWHP